jgi:hypothetical protein
VGGVALLRINKQLEHQERQQPRRRWLVLRPSKRPTRDRVQLAAAEASVVSGSRFSWHGNYGYNAIMKPMAT